MVFEHASVIDCHQDGLLPDPESWTFAWIFLSCISSSLFVIIFWCGYKLGFLKFRRDKFCSIWKKSSFVSFSVLLLPTETYYILRIVSGTNEEIDVATAAFLLLWPLIMWFVVWILNYTPRVQNCDNQNCPHKRECCLPQKMVEHCYIWRLFYKTSLGMYSLEAFIKFVSVSLDVAYDIEPVIERKFSDESWKGVIVIISGLRLAFHSKVLLFFVDKIFHGDKDLFCEPCCNLEGEHETTSNHIKVKTSKNEEKIFETTSKDEENDNETTSKDEEKNSETTSKDEENNNETTSKDEEKNNETTSKDEKTQDEILSNDKSIQDVASSTDEEKLTEGKPLVDKTIPQEKVKPKRPPPPAGSEKDKSAKPYESTSTRTATSDTVASTNKVKPSVAVKPTQIELELHPTT